MRYGSEPRSRSLKIHNDSCVSLTVAWHIFMKERIVSRDEAEKEMLFNIVLDVYSAVNDAGETSFHCQDTEDCCNKCIKKDKEKQEVMEMNLVPYIGKEDYTFFQVLPKQSTIEAKSSQAITVTFTPPDKHSFGSTSFCAYVIGFIKLSPHDTYSKGRFYRPHGKNLPPVWASLNAEVEMPSLSLETDCDDLEFFVEAACVLSQSQKRHIVTHMLNVKNNFKSPITALVDCQKPFVIKEVNTMAHRHIKVISDKKEDTVFTLLPDECAEIHVSCDIEEKYILRIQEAFWNATNKGYSREEQDNFSRKSAVIECPLQLVQPNLMEQTIKLKLCIEFPIITVSTQKIDFGPVFVGNSKWMVFEIVNQTVSNVWFNISKVYQTNEFSVKPSSGTLSAAPLYGRSGLQIKITFSPTESMSYMDYLRVQTCVPGDDHIVVIEGVGTADTKFQSDF
ncbi:Deleted in lung and esophageal cancer protein [Gryllus bimaculatus]|nr:Deleted in lung and esophageal cancer protein [Gryllus bimaculatus]